jgi:TM2 domain-containing membrane protein YozV
MSDYPPSAPPPPPPPPQGSPTYFGAPAPNPAEANSKKILCGVLAIVIGHLGIHKFVLGMTTPGLIMLLVSLLTCGIGGIVMWVIGIIEGIGYLTKTDEQFYNEYMVGKKQWF